MKILVVDDHAILRKGLVGILNKEFINCTCIEASNGFEAISALKDNDVDVAISDISMPDLNGIDLLKQLKALQIKTPVLIFSMLQEDQYALRAMKAGAYGFLNKDCDPKVLTNAVKSVLSGKKYITPSVSNLLVSVLGVKQIKNQHELLSDRELMVLHNIAKGKSLTEIANDLGLSINTVSTYRARIIKKLNLKNNAGIIRYAIDHNLG
jgi:DNA-binding NarL/FixJ family response regulator